MALCENWGGPTAINNGIITTKEVKLPDRFETIEAQPLKEVLSKFNNKCGDCNTTFILLAQAIVIGGLKKYNFLVIWDSL